MPAAEIHAADRSCKLPLAVDLDGTLIRCDLFFEAILRFCFTAPWRSPQLLMWLIRGRAYAKARLAAEDAIDPSTLPYDERVLEWLTLERATGRSLALATASDIRPAQAVADHLGLFDAVFASDGRTNLKAARKAERLAAAFPEGFVYTGNEGADMRVWRIAKQAVVVNATKGLLRRATRRFAVERSIPARDDAFLALVRAIRPQQWSKNLLVFLPMLAGQGWAQPQAWAMAVLAFWALSFTASAVYLVNDAADIDADRAHPRKRRRPFASGALSPMLGLAVAAVLISIGISLAASANVLLFVLIYLATSTVYTFWLKRIALIDVFLLASLYTIRIVIGGAASGYFPSDWLLAFSCFFFLSLALVKRVAETRELAARGGGALSRRGYLSHDTDILTMMGVASGVVAALVLALYLQDSANAARFSEPFLLWALPAATMFWIYRIWLKTHRGEMHDDPIVFAVRDRTSWLVAAFAAACFLGALLLSPNLLAGSSVWR